MTRRPSIGWSVECISSGPAASRQRNWGTVDRGDSRSDEDVGLRLAEFLAHII
jgi:hypothetical protein